MGTITRFGHIGFLHVKNVKHLVMLKRYKVKRISSHLRKKHYRDQTQSVNLYQKGVILQGR